MESDKNFSFEEVFKQNENRIHYHIHKLGIRDPYREFYVEGIYATWMAYKKYPPDKGPMSTYFNFIICNRLIDMLRKEERNKAKDECVKQAESVGHLNGNRNRNKGTGQLPVEGIVQEDDSLLGRYGRELAEREEES